MPHSPFLPGHSSRATLILSLGLWDPRGPSLMRQVCHVLTTSCFQCFDWPVQKHPWFRKGLPESLDVDAYNSHFVELSKAPDIIESREAIKRVMQVERRPYQISKAPQRPPYSMLISPTLRLRSSMCHSAAVQELCACCSAGSPQSDAVQRPVAQVRASPNAA